MPAEHAEPEHQDPLNVLGQVDPPAPAVLENARETLWAVVAAEMLSDNSPRQQTADDVQKQTIRRRTEADS